MTAPQPAPRQSGARRAVPYLLIGLGALLGCCGLGSVASGGLGAVMVDQASADGWVVWSLVVGLAASVIALVALVVGIVMLLRRPRG